jgi:tetratricopeptide (TPR) repeat protein
LGSILKALGLTIWGLIALGLLAVFMFVGFEAALRYRASVNSAVDASMANAQGSESLPVPAVGVESVKSAAPTSVLASPSSSSLMPDATRRLLQSAAENHEYETAIAFGEQLVDSETATPEDLLIVVQSYVSSNDCSNARIWVEKVKEAFRAAGRQSTVSLARIITDCPSGNGRRPDFVDASQNERATRLLNAMRVRAQADRERLPRLEVEAANAPSGDPYIHIGALYYGFGDYPHAIVFIERGLEKGHSANLEEAYVYLGLAEQAVGDPQAARKAFANLKDVPGISPRVLRLWTLYAETRLKAEIQ